MDDCAFCGCHKSLLMFMFQTFLPLPLLMPLPFGGHYLSQWQGTCSSPRYQQEYGMAPRYMLDSSFDCEHSHSLIDQKGLVEVDRQWTDWSHAGSYDKVRIFILWYSTIVLAISCVLDTIDTYEYYINRKRGVDRSRWTVEQLKSEQMVP